jgi:hypothetical protein
MLSRHLPVLQPVAYTAEAILADCIGSEQACFCSTPNNVVVLQQYNKQYNKQLQKSCQNRNLLEEKKKKNARILT